ncbi:MAG: prepilin-type N-terminal cleavage/methylation domain-containing protein [Bdellovibrionales bacterium]
MQKPESFTHDRNGFSLIELCIVLIIVGLLMSSFFAFSKTFLQSSKRKDTSQTIEMINDAVAVHFRNNFKLPCPAPINISNGNMSYESVKVCSDLYKGSVRLSKNFLFSGGEGSLIIHGKVPYKDLNIKPDDVVDAWGNVIFYSVTLSLTDDENYDHIEGKISIVDDVDQTLIEADRGAQYVLYSLGENFYAPTLTQKECDDLSEMEQENCNADSTFRYSYLSQGEVYFDDILDYKVDVPRSKFDREYCSVSDYLYKAHDIDHETLQSSTEDIYNTIIYPGSIATFCVSDIIKQMGIEGQECILFFCREDGVIKESTIIN